MLRKTITLRKEDCQNLKKFIEENVYDIAQLASKIASNKQEKEVTVQRRIYRWLKGPTKESGTIRIYQEEFNNLLEALGYSIISYPYLPEEEKRILEFSNNPLVGEYHLYANSYYLDGIQLKNRKKEKEKNSKTANINCKPNSKNTVLVHEVLNIWSEKNNREESLKNNREESFKCFLKQLGPVDENEKIVDAEKVSHICYRGELRISINYHCLEFDLINQVPSKVPERLYIFFHDEKYYREPFYGLHVSINLRKEIRSRIFVGSKNVELKKDKIEQLLKNAIKKYIISENYGFIQSNIENNRRIE